MRRIAGKNSEAPGGMYLYGMPVGTLEGASG